MGGFSHLLKVASNVRVNLQKFSDMIKDLENDLMRSSSSHMMYLFYFLSDLHYICISALMLLGYLRWL